MDVIAVDYDLGTARGRIDIDSSQLGRTSAALQSVGRGMVGLGVVAAAGFALVVKSAADFEHQMSAVKAISGATTSEMRLLEEQALTLGSSTVFSAGEIGGAMEALAKAGIPVEDMLNGATEATVNLAAAAGDELPGGVQRAAEVVANAAKTFNVGAEELDHFADVMVGAAASSTISVEDMATSFRYAGPIAAALGLTIDDLSTVLAILGDRGIKGSTAGTSLRGVLLSLTPTSKKAEDAMRALGIITEDGTNRFYDMNGALKPIPEVMQILGDATADLSEQEKVAAFNAIFQRRAMNSAMIMAELGAEGFHEYARAIGAIDASDVAAEKLDNLTGDMTKLKNSVNALMIRAGKPFQDMLRGWVQAITTLVNKISELNPETLKMIVQIGAIAGVVLIAVGSFLMFAGWLLRMYRTLLVVIEAVKLFAAAFKLLSLTLLANPVVLIIAAIIALVALLFLAYKRSDAFREAFDAAFDHIQPIIESVVGWVQNFVSLLDDLWRAFQQGGLEGGAFADVLDQMGLNGQAVQNFLIGVRDTAVTVGRALVDAFDWFANNVLPVVVAVVVGIIAALVTAVQWIINTGIPAIVGFGQAVGRVAMEIAGWINQHVVPTFVAFGQLIAAVVGFIITVLGILAPIFIAIFQIIAVVVMTALDIIIAIITTFIGIVVNIWSLLGDNLLDLFMTAWNAIKAFIEIALQIIRGIFQIFTGIFTGDWSMFWEGLKTLVNGVWRLIHLIIVTALDLIMLIIRTAIDLIHAAWNAGWQLIQLVVDVAWALIKAIIMAAIALVVGIIMAAVNLIVAIWNAAWSLVTGLLNTAMNAIGAAVSAGINFVVSTVGGLPGRAMAALGGIISALVSRGSELIQGFHNGAMTIAAAVMAWAAGLPGDILAFIGDVGSILYDAGVAIIQGLIDGIESMLGTLGDVAGGIADTVGGFLPGSPVKEGALRALNKGHAGKEIVRMLMSGMASEGSALARQMAHLAELTSGSFTTLPAGVGGNTSNITIDIDITGTDPEGLRQEFNGGLLDEIKAAAQAGRRF